MDGTQHKGSFMVVCIEERIVKKVNVSVSPEGEKRRERLAAEGCCLGCGEKVAKGEITKRGLHLKCYEAYRRALKRGETTERDMIRMGKLAAPHPGRPLSNPLAIDLAGK
jgi:hypothetical protein